MIRERDWTGNKTSVHAVLGTRNYALGERQIDDYYATPPRAVELLLEQEKFSECIWEPACGGGHIVETLRKHGYMVYASDIVDRGYEGTSIKDFLEERQINKFDIVTNPPYKFAKEFIEHALNISADGVKVAMLLKIQFLEGAARRELFKKHPPKTIYVFSRRITCAKNGDFETYKGMNAVCYAWFIWLRGFTGNPVIKWIN